MIPLDYHIHTRFSCDSEASMLEMCRAAVELGIPEIGFADHLDFVPEDPCSGFFKAEAWWREFTHCRRQFEGSLVLKAGIEIGEPHRYADRIQPLLDQYPWDYLLGSLHWIEGGCVFDSDTFNHPPEFVYQQYFDEMEQMVLQSDFDILAHMDVIKRYGFDVYGSFDALRYEGQIRAILKACAQREIALEVNTATLRRPVRETTPAEPLLTWFMEEGGRWVTIGSDAHRPEQIGAGLESVIKDLRKAGYQHLTRFEARRASPIMLGTTEHTS